MQLQGMESMKKKNGTKVRYEFIEDINQEREIGSPLSRGHLQCHIMYLKRIPAIVMLFDINI